MKVAVTDACIFIDLIESESCSAFFKLDLEIITTRQVWFELELEQRENLQRWVNSKQLTIVKISSIEIGDEYDLSSSLSIADLSVWVLAKEEESVLLTSDGTLRKMARKNNIETHGLLWIYDQIVKDELLSIKMASEKLKQIFNCNTHYKSDQKLFDAYEKMLSRWENQ